MNSENSESSSYPNGETHILTESEIKSNQDADEFKLRLAHFNQLTDMTKFISKQPKKIHIHIKNIIQTNEPHLLNDSNSGINVNISELSMTTFNLIQEYITHIKGQNIILENEANAANAAATVC